MHRFRGGPDMHRFATLRSPWASGSVCAVSLLVVVALAGCSSPETPRPTDTGARLDVPTATDAPTLTDTPSGTDAPSATDAPAMLDTPGGTDASATLDAPGGLDAPSAPDARSGVDAPSAVDARTGATVTIHDAAIYGNCFPVPSDPVVAFWEVDVAGASGATATLVSATVTVTGPSTFTQILTVDVTSIALSGGSGTASMRKLSGSPSTVDGCSVCGSSSGATWTLELVFLIDGAPVSASATGSYDCVV